MRKELGDTQQLLSTRVKKPRGKRVKLDGTFIFSKQNIIEILREAEAKTVKKKQNKQRKSLSMVLEISDDEASMLEGGPVESDDDCIIVATTK